jgi:hypothetical protein
VGRPSSFYPRRVGCAWGLNEIEYESMRSTARLAEAGGTVNSENADRSQTQPHREGAITAHCENSLDAWNAGCSLDATVFEPSWRLRKSPAILSRELPGTDFVRRVLLTCFVPGFINISTDACPTGAIILVVEVSTRTVGELHLLN